MRRSLTDLDMLRAAQNKLAAHRETRPASVAEANAIERHYRDLAAANRSGAAEMRKRSTQLRNIDNPNGVSTREVPGMLRAALVADADAARLESMADAWVGDMTSAWEVTDRELAARVDHYRSLVGAVVVS